MNACLIPKQEKTEAERHGIVENTADCCIIADKPSEAAILTPGKHINKVVTFQVSALTPKPAKKQWIFVAPASVEIQ